MLPQQALPRGPLVHLLLIRPLAFATCSDTLPPPPPPPPPPLLLCCCLLGGRLPPPLLGCFSPPSPPPLPRLASASASAASSSYPAPLSAGSALAGSAATAPHHHHHLLHRFHRSRTPHQGVAAVPPVTVQVTTYSSTPLAAASPLSSYQLAAWEGASGSAAGALEGLASGPPALSDDRPPAMRGLPPIA